MSRAALRELARDCGIVRTSTGADGRRHTASDDTLLALVHAFGLPVTSAAAAVDALRARRAAPRPLVPPVVVAWGEQSQPRVPVAVGGRRAGSIEVTVVAEDGEESTWKLLPERDRRGECRVRLPRAPGIGAHALRVRDGSRDGSALLVVPPTRLPSPPARQWGVVAPMYALWARTPRDVGDLGDLTLLARWAAGVGAHVVATLPILAAFLDEPYEPSPYAPVSRRFWNELAIDLRQVPELDGPSLPAPLTRPSATVDPQRAMATRRPLLEHALGRLADAGGPRAVELERYVERHPDVLDYARFRATVEQHGLDHARATGDRLEPDPARVRYHAFAQFETDRQLSDLAGEMRSRDQVLALDLPLGTHPDGYDCRADPGSFAAGATVGAPPDAFFSEGQHWGFPPPHPEAIRSHGHRDLRGALVHHLRHAGLLRIDHVMGLHRLWWVPDGAAPRDGAYVTYPAEEQMAVACLEAHRHGATLVGENLGTVPPRVDRDLDRRGVLGMSVAQFAIAPDRTPVVPEPRARVMAMVDTHDTATFAGFWHGDDIDLRRELGLIDGRETEREHAGRDHARQALVHELLGDRAAGAAASFEDDRLARATLAALLDRMGRSDADLVLVNLEDLWLEREPQNVPGTTTATRPNFCRRFARGIDALDDPTLLAPLLRLDAARPGRRASTRSDV